MLSTLFKRHSQVISGLVCSIMDTEPKVSDRPRYINRVKSVAFDGLQIKRAGIIPFTLVNGELIFYMGVDTMTGELTDFGGSIYKDIKETAIECAIREFKEESLGVFPEEALKSLSKALCVYDVYRVVVFIMVPPGDYATLFQQRRPDKRPEVSGVADVPFKDFVLLAKNIHPEMKLYRILTNLFKTFSSVGNWLPLLYGHANNILTAGHNSHQSL